MIVFAYVLNVLSHITFLVGSYNRCLLDFDDNALNTAILYFVSFFSSLQFNRYFIGFGKTITTERRNYRATEILLPLWQNTVERQKFRIGTRPIALAE